MPPRLPSRVRRTTPRTYGHLEPGASAVSEVVNGLETIAKIGSPIVLISGLLFYFGYVRSDVQARALGFDVSVLTHTPQDYILRSLNTLFIPLVVLLLIGLAANLMHQRFISRLHARSMRRSANWVANILRFSWAGMLLLSLLLLALGGGTGEILFPFNLTLGVIGTLYGIALRRHLDPHLPRQSLSFRLLIATLIALLLFWDTERVAREMGEGLARYVASNVGRLPGVTLYTEKRLQIASDGVIETSFSGSDSAYGFRYQGLRLLERSGEKYFLLHDGWTPKNGRVIVISDGDTLRIEFGSSRR